MKEFDLIVMGIISQITPAQSRGWGGAMADKQLTGERVRDWEALRHKSIVRVAQEEEGQLEVLAPQG